MELSPKLIEVRVPREPEGVVLVLHGGASRRDRMRVSPTQAGRACGVPSPSALSRRTEVGYVSVEGGKHAMLRHRATFGRLAAEHAATTLLGTEPMGALARIASGERTVTVAS